MNREIAAKMDRLAGERDAALAALRHVAIVGEPVGAVRELLEAMDAELAARGLDDMFGTRDTFDAHRDAERRLAAARARFASKVVSAVAA